MDKIQKRIIGQVLEYYTQDPSGVYKIILLGRLRTLSEHEKRLQTCIVIDRFHAMIKIDKQYLF